MTSSSTKGDGQDMAVRERFFGKVRQDGPDGCWTWLAAKNVFGYGRFMLSGVNALAHRVSYELLVGPIPEGLSLDHLCRNRACVNPRHLEPVTHQENCRRGNAGLHMSERAKRRTHCRNGHPATPENTRYRSNGDRLCKPCLREGEQRRRAAKALAEGGGN